ncbi:MAG: hypothetical protein ACRETX_08130 [Steroidobacteraceae bacterium]
MDGRLETATEARLPGGFERDGAWQRRVWLRAWSARDELDVFGDRSLRPAARATALLAGCVYLDDGRTHAGVDFVRDLTVGDREALLLQLRGLTLGQGLPCVLDCPSCGETMELTLRTQDLLVAASSAEGPWHTAAAPSGSVVTYRLPTGRDQEAVSARAATDPAGAAHELARRCARDGRVDDDAYDTVAARMSELDPQAEILIDVACPACNRSCQILFDTLSYIDGELGRARSRLRDEIHLLAFHYHWSEAEIVAMPRRSRVEYVENLVRALERAAS